MTALARALARPPMIVFVEGEAGIGKSRLLREFLASPAVRQHRSLVATCPPLREPCTLGAVVDAVRRAIDRVADLPLSPLAGALRPLFPEWIAELPPAPDPAEDATSTRHRLFRALDEVLDRLGVTMLVLEDAHSADTATLEFLLFLASGGRAQPLSLVFTCRPEDVPAGSLLPRLSRLASGDAGLRITLRPLDAAQTASLASSMLGGEHISAEFTAFLHQHTEGVPLAAEELVRLMADRADLAWRGGGWMRRELVSIVVPPTIRDAVAEHAARLSADAQGVLRATAVLAEPADEATIRAISGLPHERARAGLSLALGSGLLTEDGEGLISFRHTLACRAVYEAIPGPDRRALHLLVGVALEDLAPSPHARMARHFREAGETARWYRYAEQAADTALAAGDEATAALLLHELVTRVRVSAQEVARLTAKIVLLALPGGEWLQALAELLTASLDTADLTRREEADIRFQLGRVRQVMGEYDASRIELEKALPHLAPGSLHAARAMMLLRLASRSDLPGICSSQIPASRGRRDPLAGSARAASSGRR